MLKQNLLDLLKNHVDYINDIQRDYYYNDIINNINYARLNGLLKSLYFLNLNAHNAIELLKDIKAFDINLYNRYINALYINIDLCQLCYKAPRDKFYNQLKAIYTLLNALGE